MSLTTIEPKNAEIVKAVLKEMSEGAELFTAWNITASAKKNGATQYHNDMKELVHDAFNDGTLTALYYTRTLIPTPTGDAFLYHPIGANIQEFIDFVNNNPAPSVPPAPATPQATSSMSVAPPDPNAATIVSGAKRQKVDAEGRLPLYADTLREIGANPGNSVLVYFDPKFNEIEIVLAANAVPNTKPDHTYIVNNDGRVRLSKTTLLNLNNPSNDYKISIDDDTLPTIVITN